MSQKAPASLGNESQGLREVISKREGEILKLKKDFESFTYSISHDLRAPLRHIEGFSALLQQSAKKSLDEKSAQYLQAVQGSVKELGKMLDALLTYSRVMRSTPVKQEVSLQPLVTEVIEKFPELKDRKIEVDIKSLPVIFADPEMLKVVLTHLISNAIKFTQKKPNPKIEIGTHIDDPHQAAFFVRDNGAGFEMRYADKLFKIFQRLHGSYEFEGLGASLAIVALIIRLHDGEIWTEAKVEEGATFFVSLPKN
jgi:light-regulated signal transduction histidine kinase (bacteriophytochrome)